MVKYGLLVNENNENIGDDIQSYAESLFLPRIDVIVNREHLDDFKYGDGKDPVGLIMGAWFMWKKYNWPPSEQIIPLNIGFHHFNRDKNVLTSHSYAVPIYNEMYSGIGGEWFKSYGKVGCRDLYTCSVMDEYGIPNYFSGCMTLTLPKQKETEDKGKYVVLVDLNKNVEAKVRKLIGDKYEIRRITHKTENINGADFETRKKRVEEYLTLYQNAKYVVTRRLHVALPCLAMEVPVMVIQGKTMNDPNRFDPYKKWLHYTTSKKFVKHGYSDFDFENGTPNKTDYLEYRENIIKEVKKYIKYLEDNKDKDLKFFNKIKYTEAEKNKWRVEFLKSALERTDKESKSMYNILVKDQKKGAFYIIGKKFYLNKIEGTKLEKNKIVKKLVKKYK